MKILIIILIIVSLLQSTILPINLVFIFLICRAYLKVDKANLYLAFAFGLLAAFLDLKLLGLQSIIYLISVQLVQVLSRSRLAGNSLLLVPISLVVLFLDQLLISRQSSVVLESLLSLPIFYIIKLWEERFFVPKEFKLKI